MKKHFLVPTLLLGAFSLLACQAPAPSEEGSSEASSDASSSPTTSEISSSEAPLALSKENLSILFSKIIQSNRFIFGVKGGTALTFTTDYLASQLRGVGYLALESFDSEKTNSDRILYQCSFSMKGDVEVTTPLVKTDFYSGTSSPYTDFSEFNFMQALGQKDIDADTFFKADGEDFLYSTNTELIKALAKMCGFDSEAEDGTFYRAKLSINKNNALSFVLQGFDTSYKLVDIESARGSFASIGTASIPCLEKYVENHRKIPEKMLSESELSNLVLSSDSTVVSFDNESTATLANGNSGAIAKEEVNRKKGVYERFLIDVSTGEKTATLVEEGEDGVPRYVGLNGDNEVSRESFSRYYSFDSSFPYVLDLLRSDLKAFREVEPGRYHYYGWLQSSYFSSVCSLNGRSGISSVDLYVKDGSFEKIIFSYPTQTGTDSAGSAFFYDLKIVSSLVSPRAITEVKPYEDKPFSSSLQQAFSAFSGDSAFCVTAQDDKNSNSRFTTFYNGEILLKKKEYLTGAGLTSYSYGYVKDNGNSYRRFLIDREGSVLPNGFAKEGEIKSEIGFHLSPNLFRQKNDGSFAFDSYVLSGAKDGMILGSQGEDFLPSTFTLRLDQSSGKISSASYSYSDGMFSSGSETLHFSYGDDASLEEATQKAIMNLAAFTQPTTWAEEGNRISTYLMKYFGDEAKNVPYVYNPDLYRLWDVTDSTSELEISSNSTTADAESFYAEYEKALLDAGFVVSDTPISSLPGAVVYVKGGISIRLAKNLRGGIYLWKTGEYK